MVCLAYNAFTIPVSLTPRCYQAKGQFRDHSVLFLASGSSWPPLDRKYPRTDGYIADYLLVRQNTKLLQGDYTRWVC